MGMYTHRKTPFSLFRQQTFASSLFNGSSLSFAPTYRLQLWPDRNNRKSKTNTKIHTRAVVIGSNRPLTLQQRSNKRLLNLWMNEQTGHFFTFCLFSNLLSVTTFVNFHYQGYLLAKTLPSLSVLTRFFCLAVADQFFWLKCKQFNLDLGRENFKVQLNM